MRWKLAEYAPSQPQSSNYEFFGRMCSKVVVVFEGFGGFFGGGGLGGWGSSFHFAGD